MAQIEFPAQPTRDLIYRVYEEAAARGEPVTYQAVTVENSNGHRTHLGASLIGHHCDRYLWFTFRWVAGETFDGRMLRLFETGHLAEPRLAHAIRRAGVELHTTDPAGRQWRISAVGGHFGGSMDGAGLGFPEAPKTWAVWECKTSGTKAFNAMKVEGVQKAKPQHYAQMQVYMGETSMHRALYTMVCKETDEVYTEWVHFDPVEHARLMARAAAIIEAAVPPSPISENPSWWQCKFCKFHSACHEEAAPEVNCRTCAHSTPDVVGESGVWRCNRPEHPDDGGADEKLSVDVQRAGCAEHRFIPILLANFAKPVDVIDGDVHYALKDGGKFVNGSGLGGLSSEEVHKCENKVLLQDLTTVKLAGFANAKLVKEKKL